MATSIDWEALKAVPTELLATERYGLPDPLKTSPTTAVWKHTEHGTLLVERSGPKRGRWHFTDGLDGPGPVAWCKRVLGLSSREAAAYLGKPVEVLIWEEPPRGPRLGAARHVGYLIAVTAAGFVLEVHGRGGAYRWFCGWVDVWTGHAVLRSRRLVTLARRVLENPAARGASAPPAKTHPAAPAVSGVEERLPV